MQATMTIGNVLALLGAMIVLAAIPSVSVLAVLARAASGVFRHGAFTTAGIVTGDLLFVLLALFGLALLAETMGDAFLLVRYAGAVWLIVLGIRLCRADTTRGSAPESASSSSLSSFTAGLLLTLADQKAVLFYLGFLPAFVDLSRITAVDVAIIAAITILAVGGVKLAYAYATVRAGSLINPGAGRAMNLAAGGVMIAVGGVLLVS